MLTTLKIIALLLFPIWAIGLAMLSLRELLELIMKPVPKHQSDLIQIARCPHTVLTHVRI